MRPPVSVPLVLGAREVADVDADWGDVTCTRSGDGRAVLAAGHDDQVRACPPSSHPPYVKVLTRTDSVIMSSLAFLGLEDAASRSGSRAPARAHAQAFRVSGSAADPDPESGGYSSSDGNGCGNGGGSGVVSTHIPIHLS